MQVHQGRFLIRARGLAAFRKVLADRAVAGAPLDARRRVILVPTRASAELLRQTIERRAFASSPGGVLLPDLLTRDDWVARLHDSLPSAPPRLTRIEREVLLERAALATKERHRMGGAPFHIRPGLVAAMLDLYDELRRRQRSVRRFVRTLFEQLRVERGTDRGSESLIHQTGFLGFTFLAYERLVAASGGIDEHQLRRRLLSGDHTPPWDHVVVAVTDRPSDPRGLWPVDFDLLGRLPGLRRLDVVVTEETHDAGFRERVENELPGITEERFAGEPVSPVLVTPAEGESIVHVSRDREEELRDVVRTVRGRVAAGDPDGLSVAVVFQRPLPYLYLARQVLDDGRVPHQTFDALPLASEPFAALLDLVLAFARTGGTREAATSLLRSTLLAFDVDGQPLAPRAVASLDAVLAERRASGEADTYGREVDAFFGDRPSRGRLERAETLGAARVAATVRAELAPFRAAVPVADQVGAIAAFLRRHERPVPADDPLRERHLRARAAILGALDGLAAAYARHDPGSRPHEAVTAAIHHVIERQTFTPRRGHDGIHLVDAVAARFGAFAHVHLVGLVETDWPERPARSVFYGSGLLEAMGWPQETDQTRADQAAFRDLLGLGSATTSLHAFQLEGDAVVAVSPVAELARGLPARKTPVEARRPVFMDEVVTVDRPSGAGLPAEAAGWLELRLARPLLDDPRYSGTVPARPPGVYRVSRVDRYVDCPFKYFAESVLVLPEERDEMAGLTPLERGTLVHDLFERFYKSWHADGRGTITPESLLDAVARFADLARQALARYPDADRALEETRLLGSIVARGLAERVFELESDAGGTIVDRLVEHPLNGQFQFPRLSGLLQLGIEIRGKADRIDIFDDGTLRVIDYKLGRLPDPTSIQIGVYAHCVRQALEARDGRPYTVGAAMYLAFGDDRQLEGRLGDKSQSAGMAVEARASEFAGAVSRIESGEFPPRPRNTSDCQWCQFAGVCRKEYRIESENDEAAEPV